MTTAPLRIALIGCGRMGQLHAQAIAAYAGAQLEAVCDTCLPAAQQLARHYQSRCYEHPQRLFEETKPNIAIVATPDHLHAEAANLAINAGAHVFCEKPLADSVESARQIADAASVARVHLAVNYNRRYGFAYEKARELLDRGTLGQLRQLHLHVIDGVPPPAVARTPDVILTTLLTHHFDLVRFLAGEIRSVTCKTSDPGAPLYRDILVVLEVEKNVLATIAASYREDQKRTTEFASLVASRGSALLDDVTRAVTWTGADPDESHTLRPDLFIDSDHFWQTSHKHLHDFLNRMQRGERPLISGLDGLIGMQIADAARLSYQQNTTIPILLARAPHD